MDIQLKDMVKRFGSLEAVSHVSLEIRDGELFTLLGPSGCGKTTILRLIGGFHKPDLGDIFFAGKRVTAIPPYERNIGMVFQNYALWPHMTILENIAYGLKLKKFPGREISGKVAGVLDLVNLKGLETRYPGQLSGGQQQRVAFARAIAPRPQVLLLDEPLSALDLKLRQAMRSELKTLQRETGITFIFVTHDQEEALTMSDRIAVMSAGKIQQIGAPLDIYESPVNHFVADFIGDSNFIEGEIDTIKGGAAVVKTPDGIAIAARMNGPHKAGDRIAVALRPEKILLGAGKLKGEVREAVYLGTSTSYVIALGRAVTLSVREANDLSGKARFAVGDTVKLDIPAGAARMLAD